MEASKMTAPQVATPTVFDVQRIRADFPLLARSVHGKPLVYLDNANTSQKPLSVIEAVNAHYREHNANVARAVHQLGEEATAAYEGARDKLARFINATSRNELILTLRHHPVDQPGCVQLRAAAAAARRRDPHHGDGAPCQHRAVAAGRCTQWCHGQGGADRRARRADRREVHRDADAGREAGLRQPCLQRVGHGQSGARNRTRECKKARHRAGARSTDLKPCRIAPSTCRHWAAISMRSPATRCSARPAPARYGRSVNTWSRCRRSSVAAR